MATKQLHGWELAVERGPGWVFVALRPPQNTDALHRPFDADTPSLAEDLWEILHQHLADRLILQLDGVDFLTSHLIGQLVMLHKRIHSSGGIIRLCGLTPANREVLHMAGLDSRFPHYDCRDDAIRGAPFKPR